MDAREKVRLMSEGYVDLRYMENDILAVTDKDGGRAYVDLRNGMKYAHRPTVVRYGRIDMLKIGSMLYCRTKHSFKEGFDMGKCLIRDNGFYLAIYPHLNGEWFRLFTQMQRRYNNPVVCLLADDASDWYGLVAQLDDGSIVVADRKGNSYHVEEGREKRYIGNERTEEETMRLVSVIEQLRETARIRCQRRQVKTKTITMAQLQNAEPFLAGNKWGLQLDGKVIVPPIYRCIKEPVGNYRAVEKSPQQWGVIMLDGKVIVEMRYMDVDIRTNGTACLTIFPGKTKTVRLGK